MRYINLPFYLLTLLTAYVAQYVSCLITVVGLGRVLDLLGIRYSARYSTMQLCDVVRHSVPHHCTLCYVSITM